MAVTPERFAQGLTYEGFKVQMEKNKEKFGANEEALRLTAEDLAPFQQLPRPLQVLAIAEDWCPDVIDNLPILGRIAKESGTLDVRVFLRDQNLDLADQFLYQGKFRSVPHPCLLRRRLSGSRPVYRAIRERHEPASAVQTGILPRPSRVRHH